MSDKRAYEVVGKASLTTQEIREITALRALCNTYEGLDLKLHVEQAEAGTEAAEEYFLASADGLLIGYCALDRATPIEVCGMVHPAYRRQGVGRALLSAAIDACKRASARDILIICEVASQSGSAFVATLGAQFQFAEHHMELTALHRRPAADGRLQLRQVGPEEAETLIQVQAAVFHEPEETVRQIVTRDSADPQHYRYYLAREGTTPIGSLKLFLQGNQVGIYAFGVLPERRNAGLGRAMLTQIIEMLLAEQPRRITLEVEIDNATAIALYRSCGFKETTTYGYYLLAC